MKRRATFHVYIIQCTDGTYYTGYTHDLQERLRLHNSGHGAKYLRGRGPATLVYARAYRYYKNALKEEKRVKTLTRKRKEKLIHKKIKDHV